MNKIFIDGLNSKIDLRECMVCHKMMNHKYLRKIPKVINNNQLKMLSECIKCINYEEKTICTEFCYKDIFLNNGIPKYSILNNMYIDTIPEEISSCNVYEKMVTQRGKAFQTVVNLKALNNKFVKGLPALKGVAIHFPLTFEDTNDYVKKSLPDFNTLNIVIRGLATKFGNIWQSIVSIPKVFRCLRWLRDNNPYYKDVTIPNHVDLQYYDFINFSKEDKSEKTIDLQEIENKESYLELQRNEPDLKHYTVLDLDKVNENISDLNKYQGKRIDTKPLYSNDIHLDHLCFHDILLV